MNNDNYQTRIIHNLLYETRPKFKDLRKQTSAHPSILAHRAPIRIPMTFWHLPNVFKKEKIKHLAHPWGLCPARPVYFKTRHCYSSPYIHDITVMMVCHGARSRSWGLMVKHKWRVLKTRFHDEVEVNNV